MSTTSSICRTFSTLAMPVRMRTVRMRTFMVDSLGGGDVLSTASPLAMWLGHDHRSRGVLLRRRQRPTAAVELGVERHYHHRRAQAAAGPVDLDERLVRVDCGIDDEPDLVRCRRGHRSV